MPPPIRDQRRAAADHPQTRELRQIRRHRSELRRPPRTIASNLERAINQREARRSIPVVHFDDDLDSRTWIGGAIPER
jgi:hypothetical protein